MPLASYLCYAKCKEMKQELPVSMNATFHVKPGSLNAEYNPSLPQTKDIAPREAQLH